MIRLVQCGAISLLAAIVFASGITPMHAGAAGAGKFIGVPRDIDYIKNLGWTQVILQSKDQLVARTTSDPLERILLVALMRRHDVTVEYVDDGAAKPKLLTSVLLMVKSKNEQGQVSVLAFTEKDKKYLATIYDQSTNVKVWTDNPRMQGILETAVRESIPVQELSIDPKTMEILRGKVNVELTRKKNTIDR
jgi:hypothetical protein